MESLKRKIYKFNPNFFIAQQYKSITAALSMTQNEFFWDCLKLTFVHIKIQANLQPAPI